MFGSRQRHRAESCRELHAEFGTVSVATAQGYDKAVAGAALGRTRGPEILWTLT